MQTYRGAARRQDFRLERSERWFYLHTGISRHRRRRMKSLLIVDDDPAIRTALEVGFRRSGWTTECASGVQEALFKFRNHIFPLVITDVKMPDGTGLEVLDGVRNMAPLTAVILLTAHGDVGDAVRAMRGGAF